MKRKLFQQLLKGVLLFVTALCLISCGQYKKEGIIFTTENGFTALEVTNSSGANILIKPLSETEGAIGMMIDGSMIWITGEPDMIDECTYQWIVDDGITITLKYENTDGESNFLFTTGTDDPKPTQWFINIASTENEYFTGIFERVVDGHQRESWKEGIETGLNLRGERIEMHLKPTVSAYAPFYISSNNYGFFEKTTWPGVFDFCKSTSNTIKISFEGPEFNYKFYFGLPMAIVQKHALETGPSVIPPEWSLGPWRWRDEHFNTKTYYDGTEAKTPFNTDLVEDVLMMQALDIPATAHWIDRPWGPGVRGFDDYNFDTERVPQPEKMIAWLNSKDIELMMWIGPFVMGEMADYAEENKYYLESNIWKESRQILMDFTNEEAVNWWGENGPAKLARMGIKGYKLDRADGEKLVDSLHLITHAGTTYRENFNGYPQQYVKATHEAVRTVLGDDFILFPRAQYTGSAKWGAMWAGDTDGKPEGLRSAIIGLQRCAVMGYPLWGSDIGGYWGTFSRETTMRWIAFGCFSPLMETGPTNNRGFWNNSDNPTYDIELLAVWRLYSKLRMHLIPYISELTKEASQNGTPVVRPLFLVYPEQEEAWHNWQTYLFGKDILVSAIWETGKTSHTFYLPKGEKWIDAWDTSMIYEGGQYIEVDAPLYKIPVFIRKGSEFNLGDLNALYQESLAKVAVVPNLVELEKAEGWR